MGTWAGAIVQTRSDSDLRKAAEAHQIAIEKFQSPWMLVECNVGIANLNTPRIAESLSRELEGTVIAFFRQTSASVEVIEHWDKGALLRKLAYSEDQGGWITQEGVQQAWESSYFFAESEGTGEGASWPLNLRDDITDNARLRYENARDAKDASQVMDLLSEGSIQRLCAHFGVVPERPGARFRPQRSRRPLLILFTVIVFFVAMFVLGTNC